MANNVQKKIKIINKHTNTICSLNMNYIQTIKWYNMIMCIASFIDIHRLFFQKGHEWFTEAWRMKLQKLYWNSNWPGSDVRHRLTIILKKILVTNCCTFLSSIFMSSEDFYPVGCSFAHQFVLLCLISEHWSAHSSVWSESLLNTSMCPQEPIKDSDFWVMKSCYLDPDCWS